jgi:Tol biopolymer transport system component/DNA-binding winged helix-turn-helix (wHTH) protein
MSLLIGHLYRFGAFTLDPDQRILLREGKPIPLAPKVFETLLALAESSGRIVGKEELMNRLWPDTFVEEANLAFNIQQLRRTLGDNARKPVYIETVARRGYRFIATVEELESDESATSPRADGSIEIHDTPPARDVHSAQEPPEAQELGLPSRLAANTEQARHIPDAPSTGPNKARFLIVAALMLTLAGVIIVVWNQRVSSGKGKGIDGRSPVASPLKLEKLTQTGQSRQVAISADGKYIAYTRIIEGKAGIWLRQLATNTNIEIVPATGVLYGLAFANVAESLYFVRGDPTELCRVSLLGGVPTKLIDTVEGNFSISSDDRQIAFIRRSTLGDGQREYSLVVANADGGGERVILHQMYPDKLDVPVWSPDNRSIICALGSSEAGGQTVSILEVGVADGTRRKLSSDQFFNIGKMAWLPDKSALIMAARKNPQDNKELWQVSYPRMEIKQLTEGLSPYLDLSIAATMDRAVASQATRISDIWVGPSREPNKTTKITQAMDAFCWTPTGRLVYQSTASGTRDLWVMQPDGGEQRQLTNDPAVDENPAVTPDNRYVVFASNRTGLFQLWRMDMDGSNQVQLTDGPAKDFPAVSPDGKWVLCNTTDDWHLWKVSIYGGKPVRLTDYPASFPAVSPDGRTIACVGRNEPRREHSILILPFEGGAPLKRLDSEKAGFSKIRMQWTREGKALIYALESIGRTVVVRQSLDGSPAEEIMTFGGDELFDFGYSNDGRFFAVTRGEWQHDLVLISDLNQR